jgi:hypothetical protein
MNNIIYLVGLIVVVLAVLSFFGLRRSANLARSRLRDATREEAMADFRECRVVVAVDRVAPWIATHPRRWCHSPVV